MKVALGFVAIAIAMIGSSNAYAATDQCSDILKSGTFQTSEYRDNSYFQQIVFSRFVRSTYESSKTDRTGGFGVPIGEIVMGGNYSEEEYNQKKSQLQSTHFSTITASREISVALSSGDPVLAREWGTCMAGRHGTTIRFEPESPTEVSAIVQYFSNSSNSSDKVTESADLTGLTILTGAYCFRKRTVIKINVPCRATLRLPSALTPLKISFNSKEGGAIAYLPPRVMLVTESKWYPFTYGDRLAGSFKRESPTPRHEVSLSADDIAKGWHFVTSTATAAVEVTYGSGRTNHCDNVMKDPAYLRYSYGYSVTARTRGNDSNVSINCIMNLSILMQREKWVELITNPTITSAQQSLAVSRDRSEMELNNLPDALGSIPKV